MEFRQIVFSSFIGMNCIYCTAVRVYSTSISCFFPLCFLFIFQDIWLKRINENDLWNSEINWAVNVSFSSHNFLEDVFLIRHSLSIYNILSANKFLLVSHIINVHVHTFHVMYIHITSALADQTERYLRTCISIYVCLTLLEKDVWAI